MSAMTVALALAALALLALVARSLVNRGPKVDRRPPYLVSLGALIDGEHELAYTELKKAVQADSNNVDAYLRLGTLLRKRGEAARALQVHRELTARPGLHEATRARVQQELCRDLMALGKLDKAAEVAQEAVKRAPDPVKALELLLAVQEKRGDLAEAFRVKRELLRKEGRSRSDTKELGAYRALQATAPLEAGELAVAEKILREARKLDDDAPQTVYLWGRLKEKQGEHAAALAAWNEILEKHPEKVVHLFRSLERVHFLHGTYGDMESTYHRFLERVPGHEDASFGLARFLRRKGQLDAALDTCRSALAHHPESETLRVLRLALLLQIGRRAEAETLLN
ncbi:tetratricopeptide repeat protein, partial [bacterium]|nr:tetratricopeptide repeat protein [bacterium]